MLDVEGRHYVSLGNGILRLNVKNRSEVWAGEFAISGGSEGLSLDDEMGGRQSERTGVALRSGDLPMVPTTRGLVTAVEAKLLVMMDVKATSEGC